MSDVSEAWADIGAAVPAPSAMPSISDATALLLTLLLQRLKRVVTSPGSGDRAFIRELAGVHPERFSEAQRARVMRLAWRYRWQLPAELRPSRDPDLQSPKEAFP